MVASQFLYIGERAWFVPPHSGTLIESRLDGRRERVLPPADAIRVVWARTKETRPGIPLSSCGSFGGEGWGEEGFSFGRLIQWQWVPGRLRGSVYKIPRLSKTEMRNYGSEGADWKCVDRERSLVTMDHISKMLREMRVDPNYRQPLILMKRFPITITVASAAVCLTGCLHYPLQQPLRKPVPVPESFRDEFGGSSNGPAMVSEKSRTSRGPARWYQHYEVTVTNSQDAAARPVEFDYFLPNIPRNTNTPKGGHRAALGKLERRFRIYEPTLGVHPLAFSPFFLAGKRRVT
jgi:hypothetical protein